MVKSGWKRSDRYSSGLEQVESVPAVELVLSRGENRCLSLLGGEMEAAPPPSHLVAG